MPTHNVKKLYLLSEASLFARMLFDQVDGGLRGLASKTEYNLLRHVGAPLVIQFWCGL
jgi:hypothetical protein